MAFVCVNHRLCALHDAFNAPSGVASLARAPAPPERFQLAGPGAGSPETALDAETTPLVRSQAQLQDEHGVSSEHAHGAFYVFSVATVFNANAALWSARRGRSRLNLQVAYISAVAAYTHFEMWLGRDWFVTVRGVGGPQSQSFGDNSISPRAHAGAHADDAFVAKGVSFSALRVLEWVFTTPVLLLLVQHLHEYAFTELPSKEANCVGKRARSKSGVPSVFAKRAAVDAANGKAEENENESASHRRKDARAKKRSASAYAYVPVNKFLLIAADEAMIACGVLMPVFPYGPERLVLLCVSMLCFCFVIAHSVFAIVDIMLHAEIDLADGCRLFAIAALKVIAWSGYPLVYFLTEHGFLTVKQQHEFYLYNDVLTKFSYSLMISAGSLRCIDLVEEHKQKIATQMSQAQRAFFFNVTHELRTPLNSIIGFNTLAMESGELTDFTGAFIKASLTSAEALLGLINQILDFAKFEDAKDADGANGASGIELSEDIWTVRQLMEQVTDMTQKATSAFDAEPCEAPGSGAARGSSNALEIVNQKSSGAARTARPETPPRRDVPERRPDVVVTLATPEHFNTAFVGDFFRLRQCCVNLVDNAVKYSTGVVGRDALVELVVTVTDEGVNPKPARPRKPRARASSRRRGGFDEEGATTDEDAEEACAFFDFASPRGPARITFEVRDNGVGIPAAKQHALFVPFCQPAEHRAAKEKGTGLGLVITKSIVECMGGEIDFVSVEDVGTRFFFTVSFHRASVGVPGVSGVSADPDNRRGGIAREEKRAAGRESVDAVLDAGAAGALADSDSSEPDASDGEKTAETTRDRARNRVPRRADAADAASPEGNRSADDVLPAAAKIVVHPSMRAATRRHAVNILKCFRALPGSNYAVCKSPADVEQKFAQASRLGAPVVFAEASEDADASARLVEAATAPLTGAEAQRGGAGSGAFERGVVVFGRPRQLMELRKRLGHREDVACVFEPAKPSEVLRATRRLTETLLGKRENAEHRNADGGSDARAPASQKAGAADLAEHRPDAGGSGPVRPGGDPPPSPADPPTLRAVPRASPPAMSVLLVEDNPMNQLMVKHSVAKCGVALDVVGDGAEAVALVERRLRERKVYDAILMDMMMPVKDGATATREIRAAEALLAREHASAGGAEARYAPRHVIIGLSANAGPAFAAEVRAAGMDGVVSKPFYPETLRRALQEVREGAYGGFAGARDPEREGLGSSRGRTRGDADETGPGVPPDAGEDKKRVGRESSSGAA